MQPGSMKSLGIVLLAVGVVVCAAAGVQLGAGEFSAMLEDARTTLTVAPVNAPGALATPPLGRIVEWYAVAGVPFAAGLVLLIAGAVIARIAIGRDGAAGGVGDGADFAAGLERLAAGIDQAHAALQAGGAEPATVREQIEQLQQDVVEPMIEARAALQRHFGLAGYAAVLGPLSGAERLLNRAWSALVDGHLAESRQSLAGARAEAEAAREALQDLGRL